MGWGDLVRENNLYRLLPSDIFFLVIFEAVKLNLAVFG